MTKEHPIIFRSDMVQAILDGRKTQTRLVVEPHPKDISSYCHNQIFVAIFEGYSEQARCPYGKVGDLLWVREKWQALHEYNHLSPKDIPVSDILYLADRPDMLWDARVRPSIFMPRWASRILLEITDVRVEKLKDISATDAMNEGMPFGSLKPRQEFLQRWDAINKRRGYGSENNPWVWVIEFKTIEVK